MITAQQIETALTSELVGKEFDPYTFDGDILSVVRSTISEAVPDTSKIFYQRTRGSNQTICLTYKGAYLGSVEVKKEKGACHSTYFYGYHYDWTFKSIHVTLCCESVEEAIERIEESLKNQELAKNAQRAKAIEIVKLILEATGETNFYSAVSMCDYISKHYYELCDLM